MLAHSPPSRRSSSSHFFITDVQEQQKGRILSNAEEERRRRHEESVEKSRHRHEEIVALDVNGKMLLTKNIVSLIAASSSLLGKQATARDSWLCSPVSRSRPRKSSTQRFQYQRFLFLLLPLDLHLETLLATHHHFSLKQPHGSSTRNARQPGRCKREANRSLQDDISSHHSNKSKPPVDGPLFSGAPASFCQSSKEQSNKP